MTPREIEHALQTFIAGRDHDPAVDPLTTRETALEGQVRTAMERETKAQQAVADATLLAEEAYVKGEKPDATARRRLRADAGEAEDTRRDVSHALEQVRRDIATVRAARAERDVAALTPIFRELVSLYDERAEALVEVQDLLELAHTTATNVLPGTSSLLQAGYGGPLTREALEFWRQRVATAGLRTVNRRRVA